MSILDCSHDYIKRRQLALHLQPRLPALAGCVGRTQILDHEPFIAAGLRRHEKLFQLFRRRRTKYRRPNNTGCCDSTFVSKSQLRLSDFPLCLSASVVRDFSSQQLIQNLRPLAQRTIHHEFPSRVQHVECEIGHRNLPQHFLADLLPPQPLLQDTERSRSPKIHGFRLARLRRRFIHHLPRVSRIRRILPRHDLPIENRILRQASQRTRQLGKRLRDLIPRPRKQFHLAARDMRLRPDTVILVLHLRLGKITQTFFRRLNRARQHQSQRMKNPHPGLGQLTLRRQSQSLADVAEQHVGPLHIRERPAICPCNCLLDQTFLQPNPQISRHDLHDVLGSQRSRAYQQVPHQNCLCLRATRSRDLAKCVADHQHSKPLSLAFRENLGRDRTQVSVPSIRRRQLSLFLAPTLRHDSPQQPTAHLQSYFLPSRERTPREKHRR